MGEGTVSGQGTAPEEPLASSDEHLIGDRRGFMPYLVAASSMMLIAIGVGIFFGLRARGSETATLATERSESARTTESVEPDEEIESTIATTSTPRPIRDVELLSGTYLLGCADWPGLKPVRLDRDPLTDDGLGSAVVGVIAYGDLTGDGEDEAAMEVTCFSSTPGDPGTDSVLVVRSGSDGPEQIGEPVPGHDPVIIGDKVVVRRDLPGDELLDELDVSFVPVRVIEDELVEGGGGTPLSDSMPVTADGIGPLVIGATYQEIAAESGLTIGLSIMRDYNDSCGYVSVSGFDEVLDGLGTPSELRSLRFLGESFRSETGFGLGSSTQELLSEYGDRLTTQPNIYTDEILFYLLTDRSTGKIVMFGSTGDTITSLDVGVAGWVDAPEGCL